MVEYIKSSNSLYVLKQKETNIKDLPNVQIMLGIVKPDTNLKCISLANPTKNIFHNNWYIWFMRMIMAR